MQITWFLFVLKSPQALSPHFSALANELTGQLPFRSSQESLLWLISHPRNFSCWLSSDAYPLTAPTVNPATKYFWTRTKSSWWLRSKRYAEVLINGAEGYAVGKLLLDPFSNLLFSTKAEDYAAIKELQKSGMTVAEAVEHLLGEYLISEHLLEKGKNNE